MYTVSSLETENRKGEQKWYFCNPQMGKCYHNYIYITVWVTY